MVSIRRAGLSIVATLLMSCPALAGCGDQRALTAPSASQPSAQPGAEPIGIQPTVAAMTPNVGSTRGRSWGTITGNEFQRAATVTLGNQVLRSISFRDSTTLLFWLNDPHAAGTVDVVVTNPGGAAATLTAGFTYVEPESLDFNGDWLAHAGPDYETDMRLTIRNNELVSFSCGSSGTLTPSTTTSIRNGEFSFVGEDGLAISGSVVSPVNAVGAINTSGCNAAEWWADRK